MSKRRTEPAQAPAAQAPEDWQSGHESIGPTVEETTGDVVPALLPEIPAETQPVILQVVQPVRVKWVTIRVPIAVGEVRGHPLRHVEVQLRDRRQRLLARRIYEGLDAVGARLARGTRVGREADVLRWLLDQISEPAGEEKAAA